MQATVTRGVLGRRTQRRLVATTALALALLGFGTVTQARASCPNPSASPYQLTRADARYTVYCLLNEQRSANGLPSLSINGSLSQAAQHHSRTMNAWNFFGHTGDGSPVSRIRRAGYMKGASFWTVGEDLAWGRGAIGTPAYAVSAWMASPIHRSELLSPHYSEVGIGFTLGSPVPHQRSGAIYTADFGLRH
jgi:uncharacterized protein YkwD